MADRLTARPTATDTATVQIRAFAADDPERIDSTMAELDAVQDWPGMIRAAAAQGPAWTAWQHGRPLCAAGLALLWPGRAHAWCVLARDIPRPAWLAIHRAALSRLAQAPALGIRRIEADTLYGFPPGARWLALLGFEYEAHMRAYGPAGEDFSRYVLIMPWHR